MRTCPCNLKGLKKNKKIEFFENLKMLFPVRGRFRCRAIENTV